MSGKFDPSGPSASRKVQLFPGTEEMTFEQWVSNCFGSRLYQIFFKTYTEKVWGIPCAEISADWAAQRIKNLSLGEALRSTLFGSQQARDGQVITTLIEAFQYPRLGPGMMWERCRELLAAGGTETLPGVRVERVCHRDGRVECVMGRTVEGEQIELSGDSFVSTMPLRLTGCKRWPDVLRALQTAPLAGEPLMP